jgi:hypothetical protein
MAFAGSARTDDQHRGALGEVGSGRSINQARGMRIHLHRKPSQTIDIVHQI